MACMSCVSCQGCNTCEGCYRCRGCYSCQTCDSCQLCNSGCQAVTGNACVTQQRICTLNTNVLKSLCGDSFKFSPCPETTTRMAPASANITGNKFTKATWDSICEWIAQRADYGETVAGGDDFANSTTANVSPFKASEFNRIANELGASTVTQYSQIKGSYFKALETATNSYKISSSACDLCDSNCNVECCLCQKCNESNTDACGSGQQCGSSERCGSRQTCSSGNDCQTQ